MTKEVKIDKIPEPWATVRREWEAKPKEEREAWIKAHATAIERWQEETDAMCSHLDD